jgi:hypothetical protein
MFGAVRCLPAAPNGYAGFRDAGVVEGIPHWAHNPETPFESDTRHDPSG